MYLPAVLPRHPPVVGGQCVVHLDLEDLAGRRILEHRGPDGGEGDVEGIGHVDRQELVSAAQDSELTLPVDVGQEVRDHHDEAVAACGGAHCLEAVDKTTSGGDVGRGPGDVLEDAADMVTPTRGPEDPRTTVAGEDRADTAPSPGGQETDGGHRGFDEPPLGSEQALYVERRCDVHDDPRLELPIGDGLPDVREGGPCRHRPVHGPDVVAGLVEPRLPGFGPGAREQTAVVAVEYSVQASGDEEFEVVEGGAR